MHLVSTGAALFIETVKEYQRKQDSVLLGCIVPAYQAEPASHTAMYSSPY